MRLLSLYLLFLLANVATQSLQADDQPASAETQMRQKLRDLIGQLRDAQNQVVTLQATQAQSDKDKADLQAKVDALTAQLKSVGDQAAADKNDMTKQIADLKAQLDDQKGQIDRLNDGLKQWKDAYNQTAQLAATSEAARKQYALAAALLKRTVDDREAKNLALYQLGNEILARYEKFGLGEAIEAKEPFVGLSRVKLENLVQDYKNKLLDQAVTSGETTPPPPLPPVPPAPAPAVAPVAAPVQKPEKTNAAVPAKPASAT
jgi:uncharacterized coiled-coil protein SlyX